VTQLKRAAGQAVARSPESVKRFAGRTGGFLQRNAGMAPIVPGPAGPAPVDLPDPAVPVPPGVDLVELRAMFESFSIDGSGEGELVGYVGEAFWRFLRTWDLVRDRQGAALELGANPYFTTVLLQRFTGLDVTMANYFGGASNDTVTQGLRFTDATHQVVEQEMVSHLFNIEQDAFPFHDDQFDTVLFCEIIEHLLMDPVRVLGEIRRVLRPDGCLVITTPNVDRIENVVSVVAGRNIYDPYSGFGPYGRHNREYTKAELVRLLEFAGFEIDVAFTANSNPPPLAHDDAMASLRQLVAGHLDDLGQYLFVRATATGSPTRGLPTFLYRSYPESELVDFP
jgi:SAM-dependent methyltransferase